MPRIYESTEGKPEAMNGDLSIPVDYCRRCYPTAKTEALLANQGGAEHEVDQDHPPYEDTEYECEGERCGRRLGEYDN